PAFHFFGGVNLPERHRIGGGVIEVPEVLNRGEKAANHVCDERRLYGHAQPIHFPFALRSLAYGLTLDPLERAKWGEDYDKMGDRPRKAQLGGDLEVGFVSRFFFDQVDGEFPHADAADGTPNGDRGAPPHQSATQLARPCLILFVVKNRPYPGPVTAW